MSIWASVGEDVKALDGHDDAANYRAEGEPTVYVDVAHARSFHNHVRLALWGKAADACVLLSPDMARRLRDNLDLAIAEAEGGGT